jgi:Arc/MetJ-type ribon-helix-helix transcriptional regulator
MPSSYNLPELVKKEIEALVRSGHYSSKSDVVKDALRYMLDNRKNLRLAASVELYRSGEISLGKAAEIADMGVVEYRERLKDFGITRTIRAEATKKMDAELGRIKRKYG